MHTYMVICVAANSKCVDRHFGDEVVGSIKKVALVYQFIREEQDYAVVIITVFEHFMRLGKA